MMCDLPLYLHARYVQRLTHTIDDIEVFLNPETSLLHFRALGSNRRQRIRVANLISNLHARLSADADGGRHQVEASPPGLDGVVTPIMELVQVGSPLSQVASLPWPEHRTNKKSSKQPPVKSEGLPQRRRGSCDSGPPGALSNMDKSAASSMERIVMSQISDGDPETAVVMDPSWRGAHLDDSGGLDSTFLSMEQMGGAAREMNHSGPLLLGPGFPRRAVPAMNFTFDAPLVVVAPSQTTAYAKDRGSPPRLKSPPLERISSSFGPSSLPPQAPQGRLRTPPPERP